MSFGREIGFEFEVLVIDTKIPGVAISLNVIFSGTRGPQIVYISLCILPTN